MPFDQHRNLAIGTIVVAPSPAISGQTFTLAPSEGDRFAANMPVTLCPSDQLTTATNAEIGYLTVKAGDVLTITRGQEGSTAKAVEAGWKVIGGVTAKTLTDMEEALDGKADASALTAHTGSTSNPHSVTKAQVGLANVDNTSDANKPVSTATQTALNGKVKQHWKRDRCRSQDLHRPNQFP